MGKIIIFTGARGGQIYNYIRSGACTDGGYGFGVLRNFFGGVFGVRGGWFASFIGRAFCVNITARRSRKAMPWLKNEYAWMRGEMNEAVGRWINGQSEMWNCKSGLISKCPGDSSIYVSSSCSLPIRGGGAVLG